MPTSAKVPVGPATIVGYALAALAGVPAVIESAEHGTHGTALALVIVSAALAAITNLGRQLQGAAQIRGEAVAQSGLPSDEAEIAAPPAAERPESAAQPDGAIIAEAPPVPPQAA